MLVQCQSCSMFVTADAKECVGCDTSLRRQLRRVPGPSVPHLISLLVLAGVAGVAADLLVDVIRDGARAEELFVGYTLPIAWADITCLLQGWGRTLGEIGIGLGGLLSDGLTRATVPLWSTALALGPAGVARLPSGLERPCILGAAPYDSGAPTHGGSGGRETMQHHR